MATRSRIGYVNEDGKIVSVYCHWDGYPSAKGPILTKFYDTLEKVKELVSGGDMSSLYEKCSGCDGHSFDSPVDGQTIYYGRDRGEEDVGPKTSATLLDYFDLVNDSGGEYLYLFADGEWKYACAGSSRTRKLTERSWKKD